MNQQPFDWPFAQKRRKWIDQADQMVAAASAVLDAQEDLPPSAYRAAAGFYRDSAVLYAKAGLGLMAQGSWQDAAECYAVLGEERNTRRCEHRAGEIECFYDGEE